MRSLELFSGAGGLAKGLELAGFEHLVFIEHNRNACQTLRKNFDPSKVYEGDIRSFNFSNVKDVDIIAGGPPCQPFSLGGKHKASNDSRDMFPYAIKSISELRPKAFIFENVKGLLRPSFADYFNYIILRLSYPERIKPDITDWREHYLELKAIKNCSGITPEYEVEYRLINTANYGIPQMRERVFIIGIRSDLSKSWSFPEEQFSLNRLLWEQYVSGEYWHRHGLEQPLSYSHSPHFVRRIEKIKYDYGLIPPAERAWITMRDVLGHLPRPDSQHNIQDHIFRSGAKSYPGHTGSMFDLPSKTIKAGAHGVPGGENIIRFFDNQIRYLTIHEAKLIQGFPKDYEIHGAWGKAMRQIGNAVPAPMGMLIGNALRNLIQTDPITTRKTA